MEVLKITKCSDHLKWYCRFIGSYVPFLDQEEKEFRSLEPAGYINFVDINDAEVVNLKHKPNFYEVNDE